MAWGSAPPRATLALVSVWTAGHRVAAGQFEDPENARIIYLAAGGLLLLALLLGVGTWWWWRTAKVEHPVLGPLEVMSSRRFAKADFTDRQRQIEAVRLADANGDGASAPVVEVADLDRVLEREDPPHFDDLADPVVPEPVDEPVVEPVAESVAEEAVEPAAEPVVDTPAVVAPVVATPAIEELVRELLNEQPDLAPAAAPAPEPMQLSMPIVVIDTAPSLVAEEPEALEPEPAPSADDTPSHFDPLLRPRVE